MWWLDEGSVKLDDGKGKLSTQGFQGSRLSLQWTGSPTDLASLPLLQLQNEIFINSGLPKLLASIGPMFRRRALLECMRYKMGAFDKMNSDDIEEAKERRRERDRRRYHKLMSNPAHRVSARKKARLRQRIRLPTLHTEPATMSISGPGNEIIEG